MSRSHLALFLTSPVRVRICVYRNYIWCACKRTQHSDASVTNAIYHQTHPPWSPWRRASSSASDCRQRSFLWCSSCTRRPPGLCTVYGSSSHSLRWRIKNAETCKNKNKQRLSSSSERYQFCKCTSGICRLTVKQSISHILEELVEKNCGCVAADLFSSVAS